MIPKLSEYYRPTVQRSVAISERLETLLVDVNQLIVEGRHHPRRAADNTVKYVLTLAKRSDPTLVTYSLYLAKLIITLKTFGDLLDRKKDRTSIMLRDVFYKIDTTKLKQQMIRDKEDLIDTLGRIIDRSFATRKMKHDIRELIDELYTKVEIGMRANADTLRQLSSLIKRGGSSIDDYDGLANYLSNYLES